MSHPCDPGGGSGNRSEELANGAKGAAEGGECRRRRMRGWGRREGGVAMGGDQDLCRAQVVSRWVATRNRLTVGMRRGVSRVRQDGVCGVEVEHEVRVSGLGGEDGREGSDRWIRRRRRARG